MIDALRVKTLLAERGYKQADMARVLGVSPSAVHQVLSGKTKNTRLLPKMAQSLGVSEAYLTGQTDDPFFPVTGTMTPRELAGALKVKLSGTSISDEGMEGHSRVRNSIFDIDWLIAQIGEFDRSVLENRDEDFVPPVTTITAATDAMAPNIRRGDEVTVSLVTRTVDTPDAVWLLDYGGLRMLRRLMPLPDGRGYRVSADDPASPTFEAPMRDIRVLGRAFWVGRRLT